MASILSNKTYKDKKIKLPLRYSQNWFVLGIITSCTICVIYALAMILTTTPKSTSTKDTINEQATHFGHYSQKIDYSKLLQDIDEKYHTQCLNILQGETHIDPDTIWSKDFEDWFVYQNFFKDDIYHFTSSSDFEKKSFGVYLDIGNYEPFLSETAFFDLCLGWAGMCIWTPDAAVDKISNSDRSCTAISSECLWTANEDWGGHADAVMCRIVDTYATNVFQEYPFLDRFGNDYEIKTQQFEIDFVSLSVEGAEPDLIRCWDFDVLPVKVWSIHTLHQHTKILDDLMFGKGYLKFDQLSFDGSNHAYIYVRKDAVFPYTAKTEHLFRGKQKCTMVKDKK